MSFENWRVSRWIDQHESSPEEMGDLLALADRDLQTCQTPGLNEDWRLAIAYNAVLQLATAALAAAGFRAGHQSHHYYVIESLRYTLGLDPQAVEQFQAFRKKRHRGGYDRAGTVSAEEADELFGLAKKLRGEIEVWLRRNHPKLLLDD